MTERTIRIVVHDVGLIAYDDDQRVVLGVDVQDDESREDAVHDVVDAVRERLLEWFNDAPDPEEARLP